MKTMSTHAHVKWFYGQSECAYCLNYFLNMHHAHVAYMKATVMSNALKLSFSPLT